MKRPFFEDLRRPAPEPPATAPAAIPPYRESVAAKLRRVLGGEDTRPPPNWPFPVWKGRAIAPEPEGDTPMPQRRGPKPGAGGSSHGRP